MRCPTCKTIVGPWRTFFLGDDCFVCSKCGAILVRVKQRLEPGPLLKIVYMTLGLLAFKALSSEIEIWQAFIVLVVLVIFADWLFVKLRVKNVLKKTDG